MSANGSYGFHPTKYAGLSNEDFYANFRYETWSKLDEAGRQELLQEAVNRSAAEHGELGSCKVEFADLGPNTAGDQLGGTIRLNREMYVEERQAVEYKGQMYYHPVGGANLRALETALHEDEHAYQNQVTAGLIPAKDPEAAREYASNDFARVIVYDSDGTPHLGSTYMRGETPGPTGYVLYYFQSSERDAHKLSEEKASAIMASLQKEHGLEPSFMSYRAGVESTGYDATLAYAQELTGDPNVEEEINKSLMNHYYGTNEPVNPRIDALVENEMVLTHESIVNGRQQAVGETTAVETEVAEGEAEEAGTAVESEAVETAEVSESEGAESSESAEEAESVGTGESAGTGSSETAAEGTGTDAGVEADTGAAADAGTGNEADAGAGVDGGSAGPSESVDGGGGVDDGGVDDDGGIE